MAQALNSSGDLQRKTSLTKVKGINQVLDHTSDNFIKNFPKAIFQADRKGNYTYLNDIWEQLSGIPTEQALGKNFQVFLSEKQLNSVIDQFSKCGPSYKTAIFSYDRKGKSAWYEISMSEQNDDNGNLIGYFGCFTEVSQIKEAELQLLKNNSKLTKQQETIENQIEILNQKNAELQKYIETNLELENFAYIASHDLKAPLRTVMSFSQLLQKNHYKSLDDKGKQYLDIISNASMDMIYLIDDLLKYSEISGGELNVVSTDLADVANEVYINFFPQLSKIGASIAVGEMPANARVDKQKVYNLLQMLIDNAIKFKSEDHPLVIKIESEELQDHWLLKIIDNGEGIPSQFLDKAFELFKKYKTNDVRSGTGVGLTLAKAIVRLHDGKIWIESKEGEGSTVHVMLSKNL